MANGCTPVHFRVLNQDAFYFEELEGDSFSISSHMSKHLSYSAENKYLILNSAQQFETTNLTTAQLLRPESIFNIIIYKESRKMARKGRPVMLYINKDKKKMVACCGSNEIHAKEMELPQHIDAEQHEALFYLTRLAESDKYMFESTLHECRFLAFESDQNNFLRLVLREKLDEVDEFCQVTLSPCTN